MDFTPFILYMNQNKNKKRGNKIMPQIVAPPKNEVIEKQPIITTCPHCQYTISYTEDEIDRVENDGLGIMCPNCKEPIVTEHIEPFTFPDTFYHFGTNETSKLTDEETQHYVDVVKRKLQQELEVGEYTFTSTGDTMVFGFKFEDKDKIIVAKNYWEDSVFYED